MNDPPQASSPRGHHLALCCSVLALAAAPLHGQASSASESLVLLTQGSAGGGSSTSGTGQSLAASVAQAGTGAEAVSQNFILRDGVAWTEPVVTSKTPMVFGVRQGIGDKDGGEIVDVIGFNFQAPGAGTTLVEFDGSFGGAPTVMSNLHLKTVTPSGTNTFGNPKGHVQVRVSNGNGTHEQESGFLFGPSVMRATPHARIGKRYAIRTMASPGSNYFLANGVSSLPLALPVPPWGGAAEIVFNILMLVNFFPLPSGVHDLVIRIPNDPILAGASFEFQGLAIENLFGGIGSFTNRFVMTIVP